MKVNNKRYGHLLLIFCATITFTTTAFSSGPSITKTNFHGRETYVLQNELMRLCLLTGGGYIGEVRLLSSNPKKAVNPMRVPHYSTIEPQDFDPARHNQLYGSGGDNRVMAGYMGHFLCFPYLGSWCSSFEGQLGYQAHGEAAVLKWDIVHKKETANEAVLSSSVDLPLTSYIVRRDITLRSGQTVALIEEEVESLVSFDRPFQWVQHATFGDPFVTSGKTFVDAPVVGVAFSNKKGDAVSGDAIQWPMVRKSDGESFNAGAFQLKQGEGSYRGWLLNTQKDYTWFVMYNRDYHTLIGYVLSSKENPWIGDWQENGSKKHMPWDSQAVARGLLVGTSPFTSGIKASVERGPILNTRMYDWIGAKEKRKQSYLIFLCDVGPDFKGVADLILEKTAIVMTENETSKKHRVNNDFTIHGR